MNRIPTSLGKPFLRDAIVEVRFTPKVAANLLPGIFYERLRAHWAPPAAGIQSMIALNLGLSVGTSAEPIFTRDDFRLHVAENRVFFNITGSYPGWETAYRPLLKETLPQLLAGGQMVAAHVGIRYINDIPTPNIFEETGRFISEPLTSFDTDNKAMRWTMHQGQTAVIINMASHLGGGSSGERSSVVDVDLQLPLVANEEHTASKLLELIDELHVLNKQIVFGHLLPEHFVARFDPTYAD